MGASESDQPQMALWGKGLSLSGLSFFIRKVGIMTSGLWGRRVGKRLGCALPLLPLL